LARAVREGRPYRIYGYQGKQVRDNIHSLDVCRFVEAFYERPRVAAVYNLGVLGFDLVLRKNRSPGSSGRRWQVH